jgi:hypothetical protein
MPFEKGNKVGGRTKGATNKLTRSVREAFEAAFNGLQDDKEHNLTAWAKENPTEFYKLASKLIPTEVTGKMEIEVIIE